MAAHLFSQEGKSTHTHTKQRMSCTTATISPEQLRQAMLALREVLATSPSEKHEGIIDGICILSVGEDGGKYEGNGIVNITLPVNGEESRLQRILDVFRSSDNDNASAVRMAFHWLCRRHLHELFGCMDTTLGAFFADGCAKSDAMPVRIQRAYARISPRRGREGDNVPSKLVEGKVHTFCYFVQGLPAAGIEGVGFTVSLADAMEARTKVAVAAEDWDIQWLLCM